MAEQSAPRLNGDNTPPAQKPPSEDAVEKAVPEIIRNFRAMFEAMAKQLRFGRVKDDNGILKELGEEDIKGFISDIMKFSDYVDKWEEETWPTKDADLSGSIVSLQCLQESLPEIVAPLNTALRVDLRIQPENLDIDQLAKGSDAYFNRLKTCSKLISEMLKNCFVSES